MTPQIQNAELQDNLIITILIVGLIILLLVGVALLYLISTLRRRNVVLKKADYLIEDITYKSESLNVTVETVNKLSNYALTLDAASQNGLKSLIKFLSENRNYIYAIVEKLRKDVEEREDNKSTKTSKSTTKKPAAKKTTAKTTTQSKKTTTTKKAPAKKK